MEVKSGRKDWGRRIQNIVVALAVFGRIVLASLLGLWYPLHELMDDRLMITRADLLLHISQPEVNSLVKYMGYPLLLNFIHLTGMTYPLFVSCLWILGATLFVRYLKELCDRRWLLVLAFLFLIYTPSAFDLWCGTRLYRNAVIPPLVLITFSLALLLFEGLRRPGLFQPWKKLALSIGLGLSLTVTYYQKEDGIWILACLLAIAALEIGGGAVRFVLKTRKERSGEPPKQKNLLARAFARPLLVCLPFAFFLGATFAYKAFNKHYFGVFETETRTSGEIGKFTSKLYAIESPDRTTTLWVPFDVIERAFAVSETLSAYPELLKGLTDPSPVGSAENVTDKGIQGDFITWRLRTELLDKKIWTNEAEMEALFSKVNRELDAAFANGRLRKDGRIRISQSGAGRTVTEILGLWPEALAAAGTIVNLDAYEPGGYPDLFETGDSSAEIATTLTGVNLVDRDGSTLNIREPIWMNHIVEVIFAVYPHVNRLLLAAALLGLVLTLVFLIRKSPSPMASANARFAGAVLLLLGFFAAYLLAISWFCEFIWVANGYDNKFLKFYSVGGIPLFSMAMLIGAGLLVNVLAGLIASRTGKR